MGVSGGGEETRLSVVRPCRIEIPINEALDMSESLYLIIDYLLKDKQRDLQFKNLWLVDLSKKLRVHPRYAWHV